MAKTILPCPRCGADIGDVPASTSDSETPFCGPCAAELADEQGGRRTRRPEQGVGYRAHIDDVTSQRLKNEFRELMRRRAEIERDLAALGAAPEGDEEQADDEEQEQAKAALLLLIEHVRQLERDGHLPEEIPPDIRAILDAHSATDTKPEDV